MSDYNRKMVLLQYLNRNDKPLIPYHQSWFRYQSATFNKWTTIYTEQWEMHLLQLQAELARKPLPYQYNEYSAKEKADISKYSADVLRFPCLLHRLYNHR